MPELPEVETVRRGLERTVVGKTIRSVEVRVPKVFPESAERIAQMLEGATITKAERRAKVLMLRLSNEWTLAIHLKMTGQLVVVGSRLGSNSNDGSSSTRMKSGGEALGTGFIAGHPEKSYEQSLPHKHTHIIVHFSDGTVLYFNDLRKFGWFKLLAPANHESGIMNHESQTIEEFLNGLGHGPEPFSDEFSLGYFTEAIRKRRIPIKTVLLDQTVIAGVGNIYADEALFAAKIKPTRLASSLTKDEIPVLHAAIPDVLRLGIDYGGTTMNTFRNVEGTSGKMREYLKVYGRESLPCTVCRNPIERIKIGQRSSHYCPFCQQ